MSKILVVATHGTNDPTLATAAIITVVGAIGAGKQVSIALMAEAVYLVNDTIVSTVHGVGFQPLSELMETVKEGVRDGKATVYV